MKLGGFAVVFFWCLFTTAAAWREWPHIGEGTPKWKRNWVPRHLQNQSYWLGPGGRYGHSMVMHDTQIILFGGRADDIKKIHVPKTYTVQDHNGTIDFASYWERVYDCEYLLRKIKFTDPNATLETIDCNDTLTKQSVIDTTFLWNDVWMYDLNCTRGWQKGCANETAQWQVLHEGAIDGGCKNYVEGYSGTREICTVPSERYFHGAARFNDSTMLIYGGFSHRCQEYCDDMWSFDLRYKRYIWTEIYPLDHLGKGAGPGRRWKFSVVTDGLSMAIFGGQTLWDGFLQAKATVDAEGGVTVEDPGDSPPSGTPNASSSSSSSTAGANGDDDVYARDFTEAALTESLGWLDGIPGGSRSGGGFMNDFWVFRKRPLVRGWAGMDHFMEDMPKSNAFVWGAGSDPENYANEWEENPVDSGDFGRWEMVNKTDECEANPNQEHWHERHASFCRVFWPDPRAGHVMVLDPTRNGIWLHGGYATHYPYPDTATNQMSGSTSAKVGGTSVPFDAFKYYLDDLWFYNFTSRTDAYGGVMSTDSGLWTRIRVRGHQSPSGRTEHTMLLSQNTLLLQGGFAVNHHMNDTWIFNITTMRWLQKHKFERARYPPNCTADADVFEEPSSGCFPLRWPKDRQRDAYYPFEPVDDRRQRWYAPDFNWRNTTNSYYGILDRGEHIEVGKLLANGSGYGAPGRFGQVAPDGTPLVPYAKTGPRQFVRNVSIEEALLLGMDVNFTRPWELNVTVYERCTSVYGEPTRGTLLDGQAGRSSESVMVAQPRRQRVGWDGCRDRHDNRTDLPHELQWDHPPQRSGHAAVYNDDYGVMMVYGGRGPAREEPWRDSTTWPTKAKHDFWQFSIWNCANNCSNHGFCSYGYCTCEDGYYGYDCSNTSCPGDYCWYHEYSHEQVCQHCCSAGYNHTDDDVYIDNADSNKMPCGADTPGRSQGICDGYGTCQCAPPFLSEDCSVKDCLHDCSYNGYCSVEYPVSRCVCNPTYFGEYCQLIECLNNCSYPNGICNYTEGKCYCNYLYNPFDNSRRWATSFDNWEVRWEGEDCSYLTAYAAARPSALRSFLLPGTSKGGALLAWPMAALAPPALGLAFAVALAFF